MTLEREAYYNRRRRRRSREERRRRRYRRVIYALLVLIAVLLLFALKTNAGSAEEAAQVDAVQYNPAWDIPASGCSSYDGAFSFYEITADDRETLHCIVQGEAGGESLEGKLWVATCLLNAMRGDDMTAQEVRAAYLYAGWNEEISDETINAVSRVFDDGEVTHDTVLWFYAPGLCDGSWHETQQFVAEIGGHKFFCPKEASE